MKERPILMKAEMVRATLDGSKTQTRRLFKFQEHGCLTGDCPHSKQPECDATLLEECPYGRPGDRLWVKETFFPTDPWVAFKDGTQMHRDGSYYKGNGKPIGPVKWKPSIFMPRWASRIDLEITAVRVERLREISQEDAVAEGVNNIRGSGEETHCIEPVDAYRELWESINGKGSWAQNPYVWVITFRRIKP